MKERVYLSLSLLSRSMGIVFLSFSLSLSQWGEWGETLSLSMNEDSMPLSMIIVTLSLSQCGESLSMMSLSLSQYQ